MKNYYKILGLNNKATIDEIKKAYKQLAIQYHPDKNKDQSAVNMFNDISEAYQVLSDTNKRTEYDQTLHYKPSDNFKEFKFVYQDPMKIFTEVFSFMNDIQNMFNMMNQFTMPHIQMQQMQQFHQIQPFRQIHQIHQMPGGMSIHIIDLTQQMNGSSQVIDLTQQMNNHKTMNTSQVKIEEMPNKNNDTKEKPLLLENNKTTNEQYIHIIDDQKLDTLINNTLKQQS